MITVHVVIITGALEGTQTRTFHTNSKGIHRGVEAFLKQVKQMYNRAKGIEPASGKREMWRVLNGVMKVTITNAEESLFPYTPEEIRQLRILHKIPAE